MKQLVFLEYRFMLDPSETYSNLFQFENDLTKFFDDKGIDAEIIKPVEGSAGSRIILLSKKPDIKPSETTEPKKKDISSNKTPKQQFKQIMGGK